MKSFAYAAPKNLKDATALLDTSWGKVEILAGGTDLVTSLKQGLTQPDRVVSLRNVKELKGIDVDQGKSVRVGAMTTLAELASHRTIRAEFPSLVTAIDGIGSPQIASVGTAGGDLCQRPRCWYFRNGFGLLATQTGKSLVRDGENRYHAIFGAEGDALFVSPSSLGPALIALGATVNAVGPGGKERQIGAAEFFRVPRSDQERETALRPSEILSAVSIPLKALKNATYEIRHRHGLDWPYVTASVAFELKGGAASEAHVVLGHVAPVPWRVAAAANALNGQKLDAQVAAKAGEAATQGAKPLSGNAYKVQMVRTAVKRAVLAAASA